MVCSLFVACLSKDAIVLRTTLLQYFQMHVPMYPLFRSKTAIQLIFPMKYLKNQSFQQKIKLQLSYFPNQSKKNYLSNDYNTEHRQRPLATIPATKKQSRYRMRNLKAKSRSKSNDRFGISLLLMWIVDRLDRDMTLNTAWTETGRHD